MNPPSFVVTVMIAVPTAFAVTTPLFTEAILGALLDQVTDGSSALVGEIVAVRVIVSPIDREEDIVESVTPVTGTGIGSTVIEHDAVFPPLIVFAVMVTVPADTPVTTPSAETKATESFVLLHVTDLFAALEGETVADKDIELPTIRVTVE